jgi:methionine-rich copper-binding protein CopC
VTQPQQEQHQPLPARPRHELGSLEEMQVLVPKRRLRPVLAALLLTLLSATVFVPPALAHAELRQSSPEAGETVGGEVHAIALQFFDLDLSKGQDAKIFDAAGNQLPSQLNGEDQRLVIALLDEIETPGEYLVTYAVNGVDGDFTEDSFTFRWEEGAPEPKGITVDLTVPVGFDTMNFVLLLIGAAIAAFLSARFMMALRQHRSAQAADPI